LGVFVNVTRAESVQENFAEELRKLLEGCGWNVPAHISQVPLPMGVEDAEVWVELPDGGTPGLMVLASFLKRDGYRALAQHRGLQGSAGGGYVGTLR
jgi:hypothetical protein